MRPGTYVPTDPHEIEAFAINFIENQLQDFSKELASAETSYYSLGSEYHHIPLRMRQEDRYVRRRSLCQAAFIVAADNTPRTISDFFLLRDCRDASRSFLHHRGTRTAQQVQEELVEAQLLLASVKNELADLQIQTETYSRDCTMIDESDNMSETPESVNEMKLLYRNWLRATPEIATAISMGLCDEDEILNMGLAREESYMTGKPVDWHEILGVFGGPREAEDDDSDSWSISCEAGYH